MRLLLVYVLLTFVACCCVPKMMRIVEALEGKGYRLPLMKGEAELAEKLAAITRQVMFFFLLSSFCPSYS